MSSTKRTFYVALALLTAILLAYSQVWHCDFIDYDDNNHVFDNDKVRAGLSVANVVWAFTHFHASQWIPLTWISFMVDVSLFGLDPGPFHLVNVALHGVNALLLFGVLWQMTGAFWRSACVAALFALHPINVETVAWITERKSLLNTMLWLLAIACHVRYVAIGKARWLILRAVCMALGIMSKAMIVTLPFTLLLLDVWPLRRVPGTSWWRLVLEKVPLFALSVVACVVQIRAGMASGLLWPTEMAPIPFRLVCAAANVLQYLGALVYPAKLAVQYPIVYHAPYAQAAAAATAIGTFLAVAWYWRARFPFLLLGGFWFLGTLIPVSGIVRAGDAVLADRYTYVPQIGFFVVLVWSAEALLRSRYRSAVAVLAGAALALLAIVTAHYVTHWTDTKTLFTHAANAWPEGLRAQEIAAVAHSKTGDFRGAARHYKAALEIAPGAASNRNSYGVSLAELGDTDAAVSQFRQAAADDPSLFAARFNLGTHLVLQKDGAPEAIMVLRQVLREDPTMTILHYWLGKALEADGRHDEAREEYQKGLVANPADRAASAALARLGSSSQGVERSPALRPPL